MFQLMKVSPMITSALSAPPLQLPATTAELTFDKVKFSYLPGHPILDGISFTVPAGQKYAIVGGSGSIKLGCHSIDAVSLDSLRKSIAVVPQDSVLFHDTIRHNIGYGDLSAKEEDVIQAAELAELHDSILDWPKGYDTQVGERGLKLSGGEKQRVAIARAILKDSPVLVFDEATSSLDSLTEASIMRALTQATEGRTSIVIAHRLSTVVNCDKILVLNKGKLVESGTHWELLQDPDSFYSALWASQHEAGTAAG